MNNNSVFLVAGGVSLENFNFKKLKDKNVIAINKSILDVPFAKTFITMDYSFIDNIFQKTNHRLNRDDFFNLQCKKYFVLACNNDYIQKIGDYYTDTRYNYKYDLTQFDTIISSHQPQGIGTDFNSFVHGCNSGFGAIQLAIILGYTNIYLLGYDLIAENQTHYHKGYGESLDSFSKHIRFYYPYFVLGIEAIQKLNKKINLYSCSKISKLNKYLEYYPLENIK